MSQTITIEISSEAYEVLQQRARQRGVSPSDVAADQVEKLVPPSAGGEPGIFEQHFGMVSLNDPRGSDNELIDEDLAREYGGTHEPK